MATLSFLGAAQHVTGSCYLIQTDQHRLLLECGITQGEDKRNQQQGPFPFDPQTIDAVVLSHAHLDHSGLTPLLVREGFRGPIYVTLPSRDLLPVMLKDAAFLQQKDADWENKRRQRAGQKRVQPLYTIKDVEQTLELLEGMEYGEQKTILPDIELCYRDAGHIIGAAIVELWVTGNKGKRKLVFSGDLGNSHAPLVQDPASIDAADLLLMESTYGDRDHIPLDETLDEFKDALDAAAEAGGNVLIPAFAVGRTQDLIYWLGQLHRKGQLKQQKVFIDSPMATKVSHIYQKYRHYFNYDDPDFRNTMTHSWEQWLPILNYTESVEESMELNRISGGAIIIAGSGMCTGGRIRHHFKYNLWRKQTHVIIVGYQAIGTLGRALVDGAKRVNILGNEIAVKAKIHTLGGFSAHAGQSQLLEWAGRFHKPRPRLYLIHGETEKMLTLQRELVREHNWNAYIPSQGEVIHL